MNTFSKHQTGARFILESYSVKKLLTSTFLIVSIFSSYSFAQTNSPAIGIPKKTNVRPAGTVTPLRDEAAVPFVSRTLENGMEVIVLPDSSVPLVNVELAVRNGSFTETPEINGLSHLYEHMFFKPNGAVLVYRCELASRTNRMDYYIGARCGDTLKLKSQIGSVAYLEDSDQLNITNASTLEEVVNYYVTTTSPYLASAMRSMNNSIRYPTFFQKDLEDEIKVVLGEFDRNESNQFFFLNRTSNDMLFYKYPSRKNPLGTRKAITSATTDKMRMIQSRYYVPDNTALVVTGDVVPEDVFRLAEQIFGSWEKRETDPFKEFPLVEHPPLEKSSSAIVEKEVQNVLVQIGWQGPSIGKDNDATYAADVFSFILTQPDSRFQRALVDSGLTAGASIGYYTQRTVGPIQILIVTSPEKAKAALAAVYKEIGQFDKPDYFTDEELESAKTRLYARDLFEREKPSEYVHTLSFWWSSTGIDYFRGYAQNLRAVTRDDTARYVRTYIQGKPHVAVALMSPLSKSEANLSEEDLIGK